MRGVPVPAVRLYPGRRKPTAPGLRAASAPIAPCGAERRAARPACAQAGRGPVLAVVARDLSLRIGLCDRVAAIAKGAAVEQAPPLHLPAAGEVPDVRAPIAAVPVPDPAARNDAPCPTPLTPALPRWWEGPLPSARASPASTPRIRRAPPWRGRTVSARSSKARGGGRDRRARTHEAEPRRHRPGSAAPGGIWCWTGISTPSPPAAVRRGRAPPGSGAIEGGRRHGRGLVDMTAGTSAPIFAVLALRDMPCRAGRVIPSVVSDDGTGGRWGSGWLMASHLGKPGGDGRLSAAPTGPCALRSGKTSPAWVRFRIRNPGGARRRSSSGRERHQDRRAAEPDLEGLGAIVPRPPRGIGRRLAGPGCAPRRTGRWGPAGPR